MKRHNGKRQTGRPRRPKSQLISIGYCHNGTVRREFLSSLLDFVVYDVGAAGRWAQIIHAQGPYIANSRNEICEMFLRDHQADWLWFLDVDMEFPADTLEKLLALAHPQERPVMAALYLGPVAQEPYHGNTDAAPPVPYVPLWGQACEEHDYKQVREVPDQELMELTYCGMGCTLIHREVLQYVYEAHSDDAWPWFAHDLREVGGQPKRLGEDVTFCARARGLGFSIWGAPQIQCGHFKTQRLRPADATPPLELAVST